MTAELISAAVRARRERSDFVNRLVVSPFRRVRREPAALSRVY